ncbi:hypothetical protein HHI36_009629 [Cryptolaemus montrouzieri]|uniref:Uncharacterized protein n=1 Tax=Cryptolaemus montrouzieri TaxID=559131 RepID=A0ABD2MGE3_9CUCU
MDKCVPENVVVSGELRNHIEADKFLKNGDMCAFQGASDLNLKTSIDNIRLESDLKVIETQLDCAMEIMSNLKKSLTDVETIIDLLTKSKDKQTALHVTDKREVAASTKISLSVLHPQTKYSDKVAGESNKERQISAQKSVNSEAKIKRKQRNNIIVGSGSQETFGQNAFQDLPKRATIHVGRVSLNTRVTDVLVYAKTKTDHLSVVACPVREVARSVCFRLEADIGILMLLMLAQLEKVEIFKLNVSF